MVSKAFQKHLTAIFSELQGFVHANDLEQFVAFLSEEAKNLAVRLGKQGLDKKVEKAIKIELMALFRKDLDEWL